MTAVAGGGLTCCAGGGLTCCAGGGLTCTGVLIANGGNAVLVGAGVLVGGILGLMVMVGVIVRLGWALASDKSLKGVSVGV